jgi:signal-transduction protein with cAMP-binding, CBS, and nucleotidyltransferase domain
MTKIQIRHLPIIEEGKPIALVSMRHIMEVLIEDKERQIRDLTTYITGSSLTNENQNEEKTDKIPVYNHFQKLEAL